MVAIQFSLHSHLLAAAAAVKILMALLVAPAVAAVVLTQHTAAALEHLDKEILEAQDPALITAVQAVEELVPVAVIRRELTVAETVATGQPVRLLVGHMLEAAAGRAVLIVVPGGLAVAAKVLGTAAPHQRAQQILAVAVVVDGLPLAVLDTDLADQA
jgi:nitrate/nitrite transporter NarK